MQISVLTQAREDLIERTAQSLVGARRATIHLYNATAPTFRRVVFRGGRDDVRRIAVDHAPAFPLVATRPPAAPWVRPPLRSLRWVESFLDALIDSADTLPQMMRASLTWDQGSEMARHTG